METLFPFQEIGSEWLSTKKCALLADEMGLGKSAQAIAACDKIDAKRILVLCPAVARINWEREFTKFSNLRRDFDVCLGGNRAPDGNRSVICSYDLAVRYQQGGHWSGSFDVLILDEAHFLKSANAKRTQVVMGKGGLVHSAKRVWALTGTPMPNQPGELWVLLYTFGRTKLSYRDFITRFCRFAPGAGPRVPHPQIVGANRERIPELRELFLPIYLGRRKTEVMKQLPPITFADIIVQRQRVDLREFADFEQYTTSKEALQGLKDKLEDQLKYLTDHINRHGYTSPSMLMLESMASSLSTLRRYVGLQKIESVADMVKHELTEDPTRKIVIFAIHRDVIAGLRTRLRKFGAVTLYGGMTPTARQMHVDKFQNNKKCRVFIGNIRAAGTAITLTASDQVLFVEQEWTPGENAQAAMRCHRIGQERPVTVRFVALADSIDEQITYSLRKKTRDIIQVFSGAVPLKD